MIDYSFLRRFAKNTLTLLGIQIFNFLVQFIYTIYLVRYLGTIGFGRFSFALAFTQIFGPLMDLGLNTQTVKEVSGKKEIADRFLANIIGIKTVSSIFIFGFIFITINIMDYPIRTKWAVYVFGISIIITSIVQSFLFLFRAFEKMEYEGLGTMLAGLINASIGFYIIFSKNGGVVKLALANCMSSIFFLFYVIVVCRNKFFTPKITIDYIFWKRLLRNSIPLGLGGIFYFIYSKVDTIMLSIMRGDADVGVYNAAYKLVSMLNFVSIAFYGSLFPVMSNFYKNSLDSLRSVSEKGCKYMSVIAFPIAVGTYFLAEEIIENLYGTDLIPSANALRILIWMITITYMGNTFGYLLVSSTKSSKYALFSGIGLLLNILLNLLLIPIYGLNGAAISTVITSLVVTLFIYEYVSRDMFRISLIDITKKPIFASLLLGIYLYFFQISNLFILISSSIIVYFTLFIIIKGFSNDDLQLVKKILVKN